MMTLEESGLTLNYDKCQIGVSSMEYLGNLLTDEGLQTSDDKVEAIVQAPRPEDQSELRSFLGLCSIVQGSSQALRSLPAHYGI